MSGKDDDYVDPKVQFESDEVDQSFEEVFNQLEKQLAIAFIGTASSGKTSAIKCLFDIDFGNIHPIPGSTERVKVKKLSEQVRVIDAPGFGDINKEVSQEAKDICEAIDIFIYILNSEGGYKEQEKEDYQELLKYNRDTLVVLNKIDLIRDNQRDDFINDQRSKMGSSEDNFIPASFDPLPQISSEPINADKVQAWIQNLLEKKGKDLLYAKLARNKDLICNRWILSASATAAAIGALPIPGSDYVPLTVLQASLVTKIAYIYGHKLAKKDLKYFISEVFASQAGRQLFRLAVSALKASGWIPGNQLTWVAICALAAAIASSMTYGLGKASQYYFKHDMDIPITEVQDIYKKQYEIKRQADKEKQDGA